MGDYEISDPKHDSRVENRYSGWIPNEEKTPVKISSQWKNIEFFYQHIQWDKLNTKSFLVLLMWFNFVCVSQRLIYIFVSLFTLDSRELLLISLTLDSSTNILLRIETNVSFSFSRLFTSNYCATTVRIHRSRPFALKMYYFEKKRKM